MKFRFLLLFLSLCSLFSEAQQLIINEFSQGANGAQEYIELVVVGQRNCSGDSCADLRGWIIDDNNGWYGAAGGQGIAPGHIRFSNSPNWSCVPYGSIILLYNLGDKNPVITMPDDPTDANNDHVYVLPSVSPFIEGTVATPLSPSSTGYVYPAGTAYTASPAWNAIGLANTGDAVIVVDPTAPGTAHHSIAYGNLLNASAAVISKTVAGGARNYYLTNNQYTLSAAYNVGNAPADETPGAPNSAANATWINGMLTNVSGVDNHIYTCIEQGDKYFFNGDSLTVGGVYLDTFSTSAGCDSIIHLHLSVFTPVVVSGMISSCQPVTFNGVTYTTSTVVQDTLHAALGCDSAYIYMQIKIETVVTSVTRDTLHGCQNIVFKGVPYTTSQVVTDTIKTPGGCDSIYRRVYLHILPTPQITVPPELTICRGETTTLTATAALPVSWDGFPPGQQTITVSPAQTTVYVARAANELNCEGIATVRVNVEHFVLSLQASTLEAEIGVPVTLTTSAAQAFTVTSWEPGALFPNQHATGQKVTYLKKGRSRIIVTAVSENNCKDTAELDIIILPSSEIFVPTAFSPNGDGMNDYFVPRFIRDHKIVDFSIFNRWGQRIYNRAYMQQLGDGWDGSYNGVKCDLGTYYYTLTVENLQGEQQTLKGDFALVR
ncbi:gliding motility-associated C-terminal domain-containing protein [Taibaiella chishuiensis]|uniref:Gliding motility-associated-like protein n=1 Tax=Taibaiella chishuiensis TaxID=1434707 RepID=A0A2P8DD51_9BACT|nr:gliding motility-associated C-terminal domain-containing protein [Taibaiella chishuiensis]PSK95146.1 gliding motility-associated-like protein [Taibaiella chishuiensis]